MTLSNEQLSIFVSGVALIAHTKQEGWKVLHGEENPQLSIDSMAELIYELQDVISQYLHEQSKMELKTA